MFAETQVNSTQMLSKVAKMGKGSSSMQRLLAFKNDA